MIVLATVVIWTVIAIIGIAVSIWALIDGHIDRRVQRRSGQDGVNRVIVRLNLRGAEASLLLHAFFLFLGVRAFVILPVLTPAFMLLASGYILVAATNVRAVGLNQLDRLRLRRT